MRPSKAHLHATLVHGFPSLSIPGVVSAQLTSASPFDTQQQREILTDGWRGFLDYPFILSSLGALTLATLLGALIAFHPMTIRTVDTLEEAELPKIYIMYAVVGAVIGVTVLRYGMVIGLVVFGIGGLIRFRTEMKSTPNTARLIIVTLVGLSCGLGLPHFAVLTALFAFALIYVMDARPICKLAIKEVPAGKVADAAVAYRQALLRAGCHILSERKGFNKQQVTFVFRGQWRTEQSSLLQTLTADVPAEVRGEVDWEID